LLLIKKNGAAKPHPLLKINRRYNVKKLYAIFFAIAILASSMFAQSVFDKEASGFHKKAVMVCGNNES